MFKFIKRMIVKAAMETSIKTFGLALKVDQDECQNWCLKHSCGDTGYILEHQQENNNRPEMCNCEICTQKRIQDEWVSSYIIQ